MGLFGPSKKKQKREETQSDDVRKQMNGGPATLISTQIQTQPHSRSQSAPYVTFARQDQLQPYRRTPKDQDSADHYQTWDGPVQVSNTAPGIPQIPEQNQDDVNIIGDQFSEIISLIDEESYRPTDEELAITLQHDIAAYHAQKLNTESERERRLNNTRVDGYQNYTSDRRDRSLLQLSSTQVRLPPSSSQQLQQVNIQSSARRPVTVTKTSNLLSKVSFYSNSRLPASLPPLRVYIPTYPLICLAAQYSANAYQSSSSSSFPSSFSSTANPHPHHFLREDFVSADSRLGTKAMVVKSVPCDDKKTLVFAIRGTSVLSLRDWNVNLNTSPSSPRGFLDDEGNLCHSGFLRVARAMIAPIAARLRRLLEENPSRANCSLLVTGHSAGGAVASLLYAHMLSTTVKSELSILTECFKRVHCVTFGAPPVSLLPLRKPEDLSGGRHRLRKCLFFSIINEGDPVVRAEIAYMRSLVDLLATPLPAVASTSAAVHPRPNDIHASSSSYVPGSGAGAGAGIGTGRLARLNHKLNRPSNSTPAPRGLLSASMSKLDLTLSKLDLSFHPANPSKSSDAPSGQYAHGTLPSAVGAVGMAVGAATGKNKRRETEEQRPPSGGIRWKVPPTTLSNAGRLVILRVPSSHSPFSSSSAVATSTSTGDGSSNLNPNSNARRRQRRRRGRGGGEAEDEGEEGGEEEEATRHNVITGRKPPPTTTTTKTMTTKTTRQHEAEAVRYVTAHTVTDEQLREVMFGEPTMHAMDIYAARVEWLAYKAVTGRS